MVTAVLAHSSAPRPRASLPATVWVAANVARRGSARLDDGAGVLQTAINRARLLAPPAALQMTPAARRSRALRASGPARRPLATSVPACCGHGTQAPAWAAQAFEYLGPSDRAGPVATRGPVVGRIVHTFHGRRRP